jgi:translocation and assembly module TamB
MALRPAEGVDAAVSAAIALAWRHGERLPTLRGDVHLDRLVYERPIELGQTLTELARSSRADVEEYDPDEDTVALDLRITTPAPIRVENNLADVEIVVDDRERPFRIVGTDQRPGVLGRLLVQRGAVRFRSATFDVQHGQIDFADESRIDPNFDLRAQTTLRRSGDTAVPIWRIFLHAYGNREALHLDTSSDPDLSQEDIVLLLTVGMTRAEAQQLQAGTLGQTAALEALATVTGVDREVRNALPVIDDFRFSSAYSLRTGRTEPTVSVGKRISDRIRLSATTSLGESRDFNAAVEWRLDDHTSVQGGYDNLTNTQSSIGNVGVDLRWRLEFE